jgi:YHS domain-containing protein
MPTLNRIVMLFCALGLVAGVHASGNYEGSGSKAKKKEAAGSRTTAVIDGNCAVCLVEKDVLMPGKAEFKTVYKGRTFLFPGEKQKEMFDASPETYSAGISAKYELAKKNVAIGGYCAVCAVKGKVMKGKSTIFSEYDGKIYYFPSPKQKTMFDADPAKWTNDVAAHLKAAQTKAAAKAEGSQKGEGSHKKNHEGSGK